MTTDNPLPGWNNPLLPPLLIGGVSLIGICVILMSAGFPRQKDAPATATRTPTPFKYLLLATETLIATPSPETATPTETPTALTTMLEINGKLTSPVTDEAGNFIIEDTPTLTITPAPVFAEADPMTVGKYDDTDSEIIRVGSWTSQQNVVLAHEETLLVSNAAGNSIAFSFIGRQMILGYLSSQVAGEVVINIDGSEVIITQLVGNAWFSPELESGTHFVTFTHGSGNTVNLDYIEILN